MRRNIKEIWVNNYKKFQKSKKRIRNFRTQKIKEINENKDLTSTFKKDI